MKIHLKNYLFSIVLLSILFISSCEKDNDIFEPDNTSQSKYLVKEYTFEQINQKPKFNNAFNKVTHGLQNLKNTGKFETPIQNSETLIRDIDFTIDSTTVKEITLGDYTTYTLFITRENSHYDYFENLIIEVDSIENPRAYIIKYFPDRELQFVEHHESFNFYGTTEIHEIEYDLSIFMLEMENSPDCYFVMVCNWGGETHIAGPNCTTAAHLSLDYRCEGGGGGGGTGSGGGSGSGGGGGSSTSTGTTITTTNDNPLVTTITLPKPFINIIMALSLNLQQIAWINHQDQADVKSAILQYLSDNQNSEESKEFAKWAIEYLMDNLSVSIEQFNN